MILITSSGIFFYIHYCNELLSKMIIKDKWALFCYAVIYNRFKKQAFRYGTVPQPLEKTYQTAHYCHYSYRNCSSSQMKHTQHRPVVLNLITALETNGLML